MSKSTSREKVSSRSAVADDGAGATESGVSPGQALKNVQTIAQIEAKTEADRSTIDRLSDRVAEFAGSTWFLVFHVIWFGAWVTANTLTAKAVDPYPFTFLTFLVSLEAIFLTSFVLISQNHMERQAHRRAALDLQINLLAEAEMTRVLRGVSAIADHLGIGGVCDDPDGQEMASETDVAALADALDTEAPGKKGASSDR